MWEHALLYEQEMGEQALTLYSPRAAIDHLTHAVEAANHLSLNPPSRTYRARGQAYVMLGDFDRARGDYERALGAASTAHDENEQWHSLIALGFLWAERDYGQAGSWFRQALNQAEKLLCLDAACSQPQPSGQLVSKYWKH
jgi:tetratricopeptide (TPR) repeat protein